MQKIKNFNKRHERKKMKNCTSLWMERLCIIKTGVLGFPGGAVVGSPPANAGDTGLSPVLGGSHVPRSN